MKPNEVTPESGDFQRKFNVPAMLEKSDFYTVCAKALADTYSARTFVAPDEEAVGMRILVVNESRTVSIDDVAREFEYLDQEIVEYFPESQVGSRCMRPVFYARVQEHDPLHLYLSMTETDPKLRRKGILTAFSKALTERSRELGYRFITSFHNDQETTTPFLRTGRYLYDELKEERKAEFEYLRKMDDDDVVFRTIEFLQPDDVQNYVMPQRIGTTIPDKMKFKKMSYAVGEWFAQVSLLIDHVATHPDSRAKKDLADSLRTVQNALKKKQRQSLPEVDEASVHLCTQARIFVQYLKVNHLQLCKGLTAEFFKDEKDILDEVLRENK